MDSVKGHALRQFYVAVSSAENKLATLLDLLRAFETAAPLTLVACCGSRDSLDAVAAAAAGVPHCRVWVLHSELSEREIEATVRDYRAACEAHPQQQQQQQQAMQPPGELAALQQAQEPQAAGAGANAGGGEQQVVRRRLVAEGNEEEEQQEDLSPRAAVRRAAAAKPFVAVLATTDSCLRCMPKELLPLRPALLISYDLPTRKDVYLRRINHVLGSRSSAGGQRLAVNFACAGQLDEFRQVEEFSEKAIEEMPVHVSDIFAAPA